MYADHRPASAAIPSAVLEAARLAGKPVDDPAILARLRERVAETKTSLGISR